MNSIRGIGNDETYSFSQTFFYFFFDCFVFGSRAIFEIFPHFSECNVLNKTLSSSINVSLALDWNNRIERKGERESRREKLQLSLFVYFRLFFFLRVEWKENALDVDKSSRHDKSTMTTDEHVIERKFNEKKMNKNKFKTFSFSYSISLSSHFIDGTTLKILCYFGCSIVSSSTRNNKKVETQFN